MTTSSCELSIVIATYGRPHSCRRSVQSLYDALKAASIKSEVIIGINGSDRETLEALQELNKKVKGVSSQILTFKNRESPSGFRNRLVPMAKGEWVYFIDDDAYVDPDFFIKFIQVRNANQTVSVIGGPNLTPPQSNLFQRATGVALASRFATYFSSARYASLGSTKLCGEESLILCNLFIKKEGLSESPFLEKLLCCEESWLLQEMEAKGFQLLYDSSLIVWHDRRPHIFSLARQVFKYGYGRGQILRMKPSRLKIPHILPTLSVAYTLFYFGCSLFLRDMSFRWKWPFVVYPFCCLGAAYSSAKRLGYSPTDPTSMVSVVLFPLIHVFYGVGLFWGMITG